jgi:ubiquinone/menaquinone biosynthesis C-methylase UbiE
MHGTARQTYDRLSRWYDWFASSEEVFARRAVDALAPRPGERILEIGCGTGKALVDLTCRAGSSGRVIGVDLSMGMARQSAARARLYGKNGISLCQGDGIALPLAAACIDALLMAFTLELFPPVEITAVLSECQRVLRPGGRLAALSLAETGRPGFMERGYGWFHRRFPGLVDCRPIPLKQILADYRFRFVRHERGKLWGLPVDIVVATSFP